MSQGEGQGFAACAGRCAKARDWEGAAIADENPTCGVIRQATAHHVRINLQLRAGRPDAYFAGQHPSAGSENCHCGASRAATLVC